MALVAPWYIVANRYLPQKTDAALSKEPGAAHRQLRFRATRGLPETPWHMRSVADGGAVDRSKPPAQVLSHLAEETAYIVSV